MRSDSWTREHVELLTTLWREGRTAAAIAARLGGLSRSAVLGKVFRLRLGAAGPANADAAAANQKSRTAEQAPGAEGDAPPANSPIDIPLARRRCAGKRARPSRSPPAAKSQHKTLLQLTNDSCRFPFVPPPVVAI